MKEVSKLSSFLFEIVCRFIGVLISLLLIHFNLVNERSQLAILVIFGVLLYYEVWHILDDYFHSLRVVGQAVVIGLLLSNTVYLLFIA